MKTKQNILKIFFSAIMLLDRKRIFFLVLSAVANLIIAALEAYGLALVFPLIQGLFSSEQNSIFIPKILNNFTGNNSTVTTGVYIICIFLIKDISSIFIIRLQLTFLNMTEANISNRLTKYYINAPLSFHIEKNPAELIRNINGAMSVINGFLLPALSFIGELSIVIASLCMIVTHDPEITIPLILIFGFFAWLFQRLSRKSLDTIGKEYLNINYMFLKTINESLGSIRETIVLNRQNYFISTLANQKNSFAIVRRDQSFLQALPRYYLELMLLVGLGGVAAIVGMTHTPDAAAATLGLLGAVGLRLIPSINRVLVNAQTIRSSAPMVATVCDEFASLQPQTCNEGKSTATSDESGLDGPLQLRDVTFTYPGRDDPALNGINLEIPRGSSVGIVGSSGAGKSTLIDVILGLLHPQNGSITVGGKDIFNDLTRWRQQLGYVPQSIYLSDDTLRRNIAFGLPDDQICEKRIAQVLPLARLQDFVSELPDGLNTIVGDRGVRLSGGQRQRIGIARALYHEPSILILDEATSALDNKTENEISQSIDALIGWKTVLVVAHRLSTIKNCDHIVMMEDGKIKATGRFDELARNEATFANFVRLGTLDAKE